MVQNQIKWPSKVFGIVYSCFCGLSAFEVAWSCLLFCFLGWSGVGVVDEKCEKAKKIYNKRTKCPKTIPGQHFHVLYVFRRFWAQNMD